MIDVLAYEPHFASHLAPVWHALPRSMRGRFVTDSDMTAHVRSLGIEPTVAAPPRQPSHPKPVLDGRRALVASYGDIKRGRRMGYGPFAFLEHGIGQSYGGDTHAARHASYSGGQDRDDVGLFLVPGPNPAARWRRAYPKASVEMVGSPRLDTLPEREPGDGPVVALSFHFPCSVVPETRPAIGYYLPVFQDLARRFSVIGHGHPRFFGIDRQYRRVGIEYVPTFDEVCRRADVYVCDNSSTIYEFAATGRPVVVLNAPTYRRSVHHGLRFWEAADVGIQVSHAGELIAAVAEAIEDAPARQARREKALGLVYAHRTGAAARAAEAVAEWAQERVEVAA